MSTDARTDASSSVTITKEDDWFVAKDEQTGVTSQGKTRPKALSNLAEAISLYEEPVPEDADLEEPDTPWFKD